MRRGLMFGLDVLLIATASIAIVILVTGGTSFESHGLVVRAARARNPLWAFFVLALLRCGLGTDVAFLARWPMEPWARAAGRACERLESGLSGLSGAHARRVVLVILLSSGLMKTWNAYHYYGFDYGDDVEIHVMTFSKLQGQDLGVWNLRSPIYPLVFIYPIQRALMAAGVEERAC